MNDHSFLGSLFLVTLVFFSCGREEGCIECDGVTLGHDYYCEKDFQEIKDYFELPEDYTWEQFEKGLSQTHQEHGGFCYYWHD
jgi:hypothetical protein